MADLEGSITTGITLSGTLSVASGSEGEIVTGSTISGQIVGGPKGETGDTGPQGYNPMTVSETEPLTPIEGDLWYQP